MTTRPVDLPTDMPGFNLQNVIRVSIESPYFAIERDRKQTYIAYARKAMADSLQRGEVPFASHLLYTQAGILDDNVREERERGFFCRAAIVMACHRLAVYTDFGISRGMKHALDAAEQMRMPIHKRSIGSSIDAKFFTQF